MKKNSETLVGVSAVAIQNKGVTETLEISVQKKANEDAFFDKWMKQRKSQGISLKKRINGKDKEVKKVKKRKI